MLDTPALLNLLRAHGGAEFAAQAQKLGTPQGTYRLAARGDDLHVTAPTGRTHGLTQERFADLFRGYSWAEITRTGRLTDLGPLFEPLGDAVNAYS
ncbi:hypothetical protein [Deinococcus maricopensis]|uniref:Uncharacterized protein n=1 Tax=Deinococcus maricopensis (strain DSM 21211 / LMG 22137 / NRRL B-23946 / LB-34) TaxID=709986 RepID=E8U8P9_DEIML|nr:hypothetical protein [Deinococcus maricopensis]ADV67438.1 hypothetical protein Deima_1790 [Deinococcus maricopensis DSM 21211]